MTLQIALTEPRDVRLTRSGDTATVWIDGIAFGTRLEPDGDAAQLLAVIESMKVQTEIKAPRAGVVERVLVPLGGSFGQGAPLVTLEKEEP